MMLIFAMQFIILFYAMDKIQDSESFRKRIAAHNRGTVF